MRKLAVVFCLLITSSFSQAQNRPVIENRNVEPQAFLGTPIRLQQDGSEQQASNEMWGFRSMTLPNGYKTEQYLIRNVTAPSLYAFLPPKERATGTAVIVAPGGAFLTLAVQNEGLEVAKALNEAGIAAFVLTYSLNETPVDVSEFSAYVGKTFAAIAKGEKVDLFVPQAPKEALSALSYVKNHATEFGVDPEKVGFMGFSAGAMTSLAASVADTENRPAFLGYIYGPMDTIEVPKDAPPMFAAIAMDDGLFDTGGFGIVGAWKKQSVPVELHAYEKGEHGFATGRQGTTTVGVMPQFIRWLNTRGM